MLSFWLIIRVVIQKQQDVCAPIKCQLYFNVETEMGAVYPAPIKLKQE